MDSQGFDASAPELRGGRDSRRSRNDNGVCGNCKESRVLPCLLLIWLGNEIDDRDHQNFRNDASVA
jgi:hypothetical protein